MSHIIGFIFFLLFSLISGWLLVFLSSKTKNDGNSLVEEVNKRLPQTQCGQCSYPGCRPYAQAIIEQDEAINRCPPGGEETITHLAELLGKEIIPLSAEVNGPKPPSVAKIIEADCIGCTKCIQACPVDAILGAAKKMHSIIPELCTGCELCIAPCPVDCIDMIEVRPTIANSVTPLPKVK